jgi:hypothetical protein
MIHDRIITSIEKFLSSREAFKTELPISDDYLCETPFRHREILALNVNSLFELLSEMYEPSADALSSDLLEGLIHTLGREAYGMYLPMHYYYKNTSLPWGIYLFPDAIFSRSEVLYREKGKMLGLSLSKVALAFAYAVFRHHLFHFQVERFSTKIEILKHEVNYSNYLREVYEKCHESEDWLEEALAEVSVLNSTHVFKNTGIKFKTFGALYKYDLSSMPAGNRDYECEKFGGPDGAHALLASQIAQTTINPTPSPSTKICAVNTNEFSISWKKVPLRAIKLDELVRIKSPKEILHS